MIAFGGPSAGMWSADWAWGIPLIVINVVIHVMCLGLIHRTAMRISRGFVRTPHATTVFVSVVGASTLLATGLHAFEAIIWAAAYRYLGALPGNSSAILYSLSAITSYGHANLVLEPSWQLLGALEALNGWLLFGLTTAFLFGIISKVWALSEATRTSGKPRPPQPWVSSAQKPRWGTTGRSWDGS
jgi:hypothetical protein